MRSLYITAFFSIVCFCVSAQPAKYFKKSAKKTFDLSIEVAQDSLKKFGYELINNPDVSERRKNSEKFIKTLVPTLKNNEFSYYYLFDSVKSIAKVYSPDNKFRIFNWNVMDSYGEYRYFGAIQLNSKELELIPLFDNSKYTKFPEDSIYNNNSWYGAQYYDIIKTKYKKNDYYAILGWKGNNRFSTKKVIEILTFNKDGKAVFGAPIINHNGKVKNRIVFEFTAQVSMLLRYDENKDIIVFDHLSPPSPNAAEFHETYGPDLSYDALKWQKDKYIHLEDLKLRNDPIPNDKLYNDPNEKTKN
jgi:hypothetical protein